MPTFMALERCPQLVIVPTRFDLYRAESARVRAIFLEYTPLVEPLSLDEAYLDVSHLPRPATQHRARKSARASTLRQDLTASAGVAPNKMLAKIASDLNKPNGQYTIKPAAVAAFMETHCPRARSRALAKSPPSGWPTISAWKRATNFRRTPANNCASGWASSARSFMTAAGGIDHRPVEPNRVRKSLSNENTFSTNLTSLAECQERLGELHADLLQDLAKQGPERAVAKLFVKLRFADFSHTTVERGGDVPALEMYQTLLAEGWQRREEPRRVVRLLGVGVRFQPPAQTESTPVGTAPLDQLVFAL